MAFWSLHLLTDDARSGRLTNSLSNLFARVNLFHRSRTVYRGRILLQAILFNLVNTGHGDASIRHTSIQLHLRNAPLLGCFVC
jgi:hypothetical protein